MKTFLGTLTIVAFVAIWIWVQAKKDRVDRAARRKYLKDDPLYEGDKNRK